MNARVLASLPFELAYLALLTKYGLKRLSRWEYALPDAHAGALQDLNLHVAPVERRTILGRRTSETVFSAASGPARVYLSRFDGRRLSSSPEITRLEGFLFGYPACCVEEFIRHPYSANRLPRKDQRILFHWACPGCRVTPGLLKEYRLIHKECLRLFGGSEPAWQPTRLQAGLPIPDLLSVLQRAALPAAVCLSALMIAPRAAGASDPHLLPVESDIDCDYLSFEEEILRGVDWYNQSTRLDTVLDGVALALEVKALIDSLPGSPQADRPYKVYGYQYGIETCGICGEVVNMGYIRIVHPLRGLSIDVPFIAYHYLEHGSLSYMGSIHEGRLDFSLLKRILLCAEDSHTSYSDSDQDGLDDLEESFIGTDATDPDSDGDSVKDGPQYFEGLIESISSISREVSDIRPYMIEMHTDGVEACEICGNMYDMGFVQLVNPLEDLTVDIPYVALHYLAHGSVAYRGDYNMGRLLPTVVNTVLEGDGTAHWREVEGDTDGDGLKDDEEIYFSLDPDDPDSDGDGLPDGPALAEAMHAMIEGLPREKCADSVYRIDHWARGFHTCHVCGEVVNMGGIEIVNPLDGGTPLWLDYISLHFMGHGSFENDRLEEIDRADPRLIDEALGSPAYVPARPPIPRVLQVFPNPFVGRTRIVCDIPRAAVIKVTIHDAAGRQVMEFPPASLARHEVVWDGTDRDGRRLPAGAYFVRLDLGGMTLSKKVMLLR
jgi:hypothetical protein